jgi:translation initiation factor 2 subunit 2
MDNYKELLENVYENMKKIDKNKDRFEILKIKGYFQGKKTILTNFFQIASHIRRDPEHLQKFLFRELATSGVKDGEKLILNIRVPSSKINNKIEDYINEFVLCKECKKPDTEIIKDSQKRINFIHCLACGAKYPIKGKIN